MNCEARNVKRRRIAALSGLGLVLALVGHGPVLAQDGAVVGWGDRVVVPQSTLTAVIVVAAGSSHNLALTKDGSIVAWGGE